MTLIEFRLDASQVREERKPESERIIIEATLRPSRPSKSRKIFEEECSFAS